MKKPKSWSREVAAAVLAFDLYLFYLWAHGSANAEGPVAMLTPYAFIMAFAAFGFDAVVRKLLAARLPGP